MAQEYGKLFSTEEAYEKFGPVISSANFTVDTLIELLTQTTGYIMFKLVDDDVIILDDEREAIHPLGTNVDDQTVFTMFKTSIVNELISQNDEPELWIEQRSEVLSITYGNLTLEMGAPCPPFCMPDSE